MPPENMYTSFAGPSVWTGTRLLNWGNSSEDYTGRGVQYLPNTDQWIDITVVGAPSPRTTIPLVWSGSKMIAWGGEDMISSGQTTLNGGRYDPLADNWQKISTVNEPDARRRFHSAVWTGSRMVVWGGETVGLRNQYAPPFADGGAYDPVLDHWTTFKACAPSIEARANHMAVWTGSEMIVWGGRAELNSRGDQAYFDSGWVYKP